MPITDTKVYSDRYLKALNFVAEGHQYHTRREGTPYITHLLSVSALVYEYGGTEEEAIAALLHDYVEDIWRENPEEGMSRVINDLGIDVARFIYPLTEWDKSLSWEERKAKYLAQLEDAPYSSILVSACDKYHNILSYLREIEFGADVTDVSKWRRERTWKFLHNCLSIYYRRYSNFSKPTYTKFDLLLDKYSEALNKLRDHWS